MGLRAEVLRKTFSEKKSIIGQTFQDSAVSVQFDESMIKYTKFVHMLVDNFRDFLSHLKF